MILTWFCDFALWIQFGHRNPTKKLSYDRFGHGIQRNTEYGIQKNTEYEIRNIVEGTLGGQQVAMAHLCRTQKSHVANLFV